jgi:hypothetical protein
MVFLFCLSAIHSVLWNLTAGQLALAWLSQFSKGQLDSNLAQKRMKHYETTQTTNEQ